MSDGKMGLFTRLASMQPRPLQQFLAILFAVLIGGVSMAPAALAIAPTDLPDQRPVSHVIDDADVLSRASRKELENRLEAFGGNKLDARLVTLRRLDYGLSLGTFGTQLIERWSSSGDINSPLLLFLIDTQNKRSSIQADSSLDDLLPQALLKSTGRTTMAIPLREGDRYRQASVDGLNRLSIVLDGGEDPGAPEEFVRTTLPTNIPTQEETESSNATTWIIVLLVVGTIIPMATWWVFSR